MTRTALAEIIEDYANTIYFDWYEAGRDRQNELDDHVKQHMVALAEHIRNYDK